MADALSIARMKNAMSESIGGTMAQGRVIYSTTRKTFVGGFDVHVKMLRLASAVAMSVQRVCLWHAICTVGHKLDVADIPPAAAISSTRPVSWSQCVEILASA